MTEEKLNELKPFIDRVINNFIFARVNSFQDYIFEHYPAEVEEMFMNYQEKWGEEGYGENPEIMQVWIVDSFFGEWIEKEGYLAFENEDGSYFWFRTSVGAGLDSEPEVYKFAEYIAK